MALTLNPYGYVFKNPLSYTDPTGEAAPLAVPMGIGIGRAAIYGYRAYKAYRAVQAAKARAAANEGDCADDDESCRSHFKKCLEAGWGGIVGFDSACFA